MNESRRSYRVSAPTTEQINFALRLIADRLDELEGRRGTPTFKGHVNMDSHKIRALASGSDAGDAVRKDQIDIDLTGIQAEVDNHIADTSNPHQVTHSQLPDKGASSHAQIDTHIGTADAHFSNKAIHMETESHITLLAEGSAVVI